MSTTSTETATDRIYTACVGSGKDRYIQLPENDQYATLDEARAIADSLRAAGYRGAYIVDNRTGKAVR